MKTSCEFHFGFWDVTAREDAAFKASDNQPWAKIEDINLEEGAAAKNVTTLEPDFGWPLDGSKQIISDTPALDEWGWWSPSLSGANGRFSAPPTLTVTFTENHSSAGITFRFVATLPRSVDIKWYSLDGTLLTSRSFIPDKFEYFCDCQVENYGKVVITIPAMAAAHRYLRCTFILFGVLEILDDARIRKAEICEETNLISLTLPINTLALSFFTPGGRFSLLNPSGAYRFFQWKQPVNAYAVIDGKQKDMGVYYLQEASGFVDNLADLALVDIVGILDTLEFDGGLYVNTPIRELLDAILDPEDVAYYLDPALEGSTITGYLPICSKRTALQQTAFALGAIVDTARGEVMRFYPTPTDIHHTIGPDRKVIGHKVTLEELVTRVDVTAHTYRLEDEVRELTKAVLGVGRHRLTFASPVSVTGITGGTLVENHPNYAVVDVAVAGEVVLSGKEYLDDTAIYTVQTDPLPAGTKSSVKLIKEATLIDPSRAKAAAQRVFDYYQLRYVDEGVILPGDEKIAQKIGLESLGGQTLTAGIERLNIDLTGGYLAKQTVRGA